MPDAPTPQQPDSLGNLTTGVTPGKGTQRDTPDAGHEYHPGAAGNGKPVNRTGPGAAEAARSPRIGAIAKDLATLPHESIT